MNLLQDMVRVRDKVYSLKQKERNAKSIRTGKYTSIFEPITNSLKDLNNRPATTDSSTNTQSIDTSDIKTSTKDDEDDDLYKLLYDVVPGDSKKGILIPEGYLYRQALSSIAEDDRDDGVLGLNDRRKFIGDYSYFVSGDILNVQDKNGSREVYVIKELDLWLLLLAQTPNKAGFSGSYMKSPEFLSVVDRYSDIVAVTHPLFA